MQQLITVFLIDRANGDFTASRAFPAWGYADAYIARAKSWARDAGEPFRVERAERSARVTVG